MNMTTLTRSFAVLSLLAAISCSENKAPNKENKNIEEIKSDVLFAFGSCSNQAFEEQMWGEINQHKPEVWIWGGDAVYSDTENPKYMKEQYDIQKSKLGYQELLKNTKVIGTWDDHDYGANDAGIEYPMKYESKKMFLDFLDVPENDIRRSRDGVYTSYDYKYEKGSIKVILLDARFFRTQLTIDPTGEKRYIDNKNNDGTILGKEQWLWLENELNNSKANFNIIVTGIQVLSNLHGFEAWGNMPNEREKLLNTIAKSKSKGTFILSGDRHVCEISKIKIENMDYPIYDITSSGLSHSYKNVGEEENPYRVSDLVGLKNFALMGFDFEKNTVQVEIKGKENKLLIQKVLKY